MTVISSGKLPVTATARDCFEQLAFSSVLKKLFLSRRVVENAGVLPAAAVLCRAVANAASLALPTCSLCSCNEASLCQQLSPPKVSPTAGQGHPECQTQDCPLNSVKKEGTHQSRRECKTTPSGTWGSTGRMPGRSRSFISSIFVVTTTPQTKMYTEFLAGWSQQSTCILYRKEF